MFLPAKENTLFKYLCHNGVTLPESKMYVFLFQDNIFLRTCIFASVLYKNFIIAFEIRTT